MDPALELRRARGRAGLTQRELAARSGTSQATISAYESGRKLPGVVVLARLLAAAGAELRVDDAPGRRTSEDLRQTDERLQEVLHLAGALPFRRPGPLRFPRLPAAT